MSEAISGGRTVDGSAKSGNPRFFVDERCGCIAVRDRERVPNDYPGLHSYTPGNVWYQHGEYDESRREWRVDAAHVETARWLADLLNAGWSAGGLRAELADAQSQLAQRDARIAELEAEASRLRGQVQDLHGRLGGILKRAGDSHEFSRRCLDANRASAESHLRPRPEGAGG